MADGGEDCSDWLRSWNQFEQQCVEEVEGEGNMEERLAGEREDVAQKLWLSFQNSATAIVGRAPMCGRCFRTQPRLSPSCTKCGYQRRTRDVVAWAKKRRRHIRREELLAFLCGKTVPSRTGSRSPPRSARESPRLGSQEYAPSHQSEIDLQPFKDAIALQGLNGAMASFGLRTPTSPSHNMHSTPSRRRNLGELHAFISEEFANHMDSNSPNGRKRSSGNDLLGDSPVHKRSRHL
ncbi:hypothetical protein Bbelb_273610 [Branchiostoma belcheri]|nr:hypothetical protein Bbelb_273610 [Branchiostoma belcheri]